MNKNTRSKFNYAHDAFARVKHGRAHGNDAEAAKTVGAQPRLSKHPKVARQKGESK